MKTKKKHLLPSRAHDKAAGFTLLELLIVLAILALIAGIAVPQIFNVFGGAQADAARLQIKALSNTLGFYRLDVGRYPTTDEGLQALLSRPQSVTRWAGPYMADADSLTDPWGNPYVYRSTSESVIIMSYGADGEEGGDGDNADIVESIVF